MNKKKITALLTIVVVLLAILVAVLLMDSSDDTPTTTPSDATDTTNYDTVSYDEKGDIYRCSIKSITEISVDTNDESFTFLKNGDSWECDRLSSEVLNTANISRLVSRISTLKYVEAFDESVSAEDCAITDASPKITFVSDLGTIIVKMAESFTDSELSYVSASVSDLVYSVKKDTTDILFQPLRNYRKDSLSNMNFDAANEIVLVNATDTVTLKKSQTDVSNAIYNEWRMIAPVEMIASDTSVNDNIITAMKNMDIFEYVDDSGKFADYGLDSKNMYLKITDTNGKTQTLYFSEKKDGVCYVSIDDSMSIYAVDASLMPFTNLKAIDFADRHVKLVMKDSLSVVEVDSADADYTIEVSQTRNESKVNGTMLDETEFSRTVFANVCGLIADDIYTGESGDTLLTVTYTYVDSTEDVLEFSEYNDRYYAVSENGETRFIIQISKLDGMLEALKPYR